MMNKVLVAVPTFDYTVLGATVASIMAARKRKDIEVEFRITGFSGLTANFNNLYAEALSGLKTGTTHFAMIHSDIDAEALWIDKLMGIMEKFEADIVSTIVPIKDSRGLTSTAFENPLDPWRPRRLTLKEAYTLEPSFTTPDLLLNTGLMLIDIRKDYMKQMRFHVEDKIEEVEPGVFEHGFFSEDWLFSRELRFVSGGTAKLVATREVACRHAGIGFHDNQSAWGTMERDEAKTHGTDVVTK